MSEEKKSFLVDVPVRVCIWIRKETQRKQFEIIKQARPSILFLQSDGGRNEKEWESIKYNRNLYDTEIDWDCTVYRLYEEENLGLYTMSKKASDFIWEHVDRCIFLEDDHLPSVSFFEFCAELLEKYKDDTRVSRICGMNHEGISEDVSSDYFFAHHGSIWGGATWRRVFEMRDTEFRYGKDPYVMDVMKNFTKDNKFFMDKAEGYAKDRLYENHPAGGEFFNGFATYGYHQLQIIPKRNMIKNIGYGEGAAHADALKFMPRGIQQMFDMQTYETEIPLKHMDYMIPDLRYDKKVKRILGIGHPFVMLYRRIEGVCRHIWYGDTLNILKKAKKKLKKQSTIEK